MTVPSGGGWRPGAAGGWAGKDLAAAPRDVDRVRAIVGRIHRESRGSRTLRGSFTELVLLLDPKLWRQIEQIGRVPHRAIRRRAATRCARQRIRKTPRASGHARPPISDMWTRMKSIGDRESAARIRPGSQTARPSPPGSLRAGAACEVLDVLGRKRSSRKNSRVWLQVARSPIA